MNTQSGGPETPEDMMNRILNENLRLKEEQITLLQDRLKGAQSSKPPGWLIILSVALALAVGWISIHLINKDDGMSADDVAKVVARANQPLLTKLDEIKGNSDAAMAKANAAAEDAKISEVEKAAILAPVNQRLDNLPTTASLNLEITKAVTEGVKPVSDRLAELERAKAAKPAPASETKPEADKATGTDSGWKTVTPVRHDEEPVKTPAVIKWIEKDGYAIPLRKMPDGFAGYGDTYSSPPNNGAKPGKEYLKKIATSNPPQGWARNERGDWAIPLQ